MKSDEIAVSRQGNFAVINHNKFEIKFNLSKGTWDYIDESGDTIIQNGCTGITLEDGTVVKTEDAGAREFLTAVPETDAFGCYHQIRFSHEATGKGIRINTYLNCYTAHPAIHLKVGVENLKSEPLHLNSVTVLGVSGSRGAVVLGGLPSDYHLFINRPPVSPGVNKRLYDGFLLSDTDAMHPSHDGVLHDTKSGKALVFGFLTTEKWWPRIQVGWQGEAGRGAQGRSQTSPASGVNPWALYHQCGQRLGAGEELTSETVYINFTGGATAAYEHYITRVAALNVGGQHEGYPEMPLDGAQSDTPIAAWSLPWTQESLDGNVILSQTEELAENPLFQPNCPGGVDYIQLDARAATELESLMPVPESSALQNLEGMQAIVNQLRGKGFKAGIRMDPLCVTLDSELIQNHPNYCIQERMAARGGRGGSRRRSGRNDYKPATVHLPDSGKEVALLDVSHPKVQARLREQIRHVVKACGYSLINADFTAYTAGLTNTSNHLRWHDESLTSVQLYRLAVEFLRDTIQEVQLARVPPKEDVLLAGYNAVSGPGIGSLSVNAPLLSPPLSTDGAVSNRTGDPWHHLRGTKHRLSRYAAHLREHNVLWGHVFGELAVDEPRPINEAIVEMTAAALSGGAVFCADSLATLTPSRAAHLAKIFPLTGKAATPVDLYDEPFSQIWSLPVSTSREAWHLAAVFNWNDREEDTYFELSAIGLSDAKEFLVHDFWMRQYLGKVSQSVTLLNIPPRSVKLLCFREEQDVPQLLATDMHYTQGVVEILSAGWDTNSQTYLLVCKPLRQADGTCFIHVPEGYLPIGVATYGSDYQYQWDNPIYKLTFRGMHPDRLVNASIRFTKTSGGTLK